jgi:hypothetical protein
VGDTMSKKAREDLMRKMVQLLRAGTEQPSKSSRNYRYHDARRCYSLRRHRVAVAGRASGAAVTAGNRLDP